VLDEELDAFLTSPVMVLMAVRGADGRPALGRSMSARRGPARTLDIFVSAAQWPKAVAAATAGAPVAVTFSRPSDYRTFQVKGRLTASVSSSQADHALAERYQHAMGRIMTTLGVRPVYLARWLTREGLTTLSLEMEEVFVQTPGPGAGRPLEASAR
jgi:hypothetical protein